ncbi:hypothetical protein TNCV_2367241 [Trichonephila clavipes]|nr:hypothetical protein TNCV_2367241 [Trichonephila clavipes]
MPAVCDCDEASLMTPNSPGFPSCEKCWMQVSPVPASDEVCPPVCASYERCSCVFLLVKSAREVPAFRFFPEKDEEDVSSVSTCNVKVSLFL